MKTIKLVTDNYFIKELLSDVYTKYTYDDSPSLREFKPTGVWFVLMEDTLAAGLINLNPLNNVTWMPHIIIYDEFRGKDSYLWGEQVIRAMRIIYGVEKFLAFTPYKTAKKYAEKLGFKQTGILTKSIKKNGELLDQFILEL